MSLQSTPAWIAIKELREGLSNHTDIPGDFACVLTAVVFAQNQ